MPSLIHEEIYEKFCQTLRNHFLKDINQYKFEDWYGAKANDLLKFREYLNHADIPFAASGFLSSQGNLLSSRVLVSRDDTTEPLGLYRIYPDTDHEIAIGLFDLSPDSYDDHTVVAYRDRKTLEELLRGLASFRRTHFRTNGMIARIKEHDIPVPKSSWNDIILPEEIKADIRHNIEGFIKGEEIYRRLSIPYRRGFLFAGPPGNGKTMLLKILAANYPEMKFVLYSQSDSERNSAIDWAFTRAKSLSPSILCFEDLDSLFKNNISLSYFLNKLDGFEHNEGVMILATTNHPEEIDPALTNRPSRFDRLWLLPNPDSNCRLRMLRRLFGTYVNEGIIEGLAEQTNSFSMVYLKELYVSASLIGIDRGNAVPDEDDINRALARLKTQFRTASRQFVSEDRKVGFAGLRVMQME